MDPTQAHLSECSPRYEAWVRVFGSNTVELEDPVGRMALLPGRGRTHVYMLRISSLSAEQKDRLVAWLAEKWSLPADQVRADLDGEHGCPIPAEDVSVSFDVRLVI